MMQKDLSLVVGSAAGALVVAVAAVGGVLCCPSPVVAAVLGVGGMMAGARLAPYRPYFLAASAPVGGAGFSSAAR